MELDGSNPGKHTADITGEITLKCLSRTHDYTFKTWGHDYVFTPIDGGLRGKMVGWGEDIIAGDYLLLKQKTGETTRYQIDCIQYCRNPRDMWDAEVTFAPRPAGSPVNG